MKITCNWNQYLIGIHWGGSDYGWLDCRVRFYICLGPFTMIVKFGKEKEYGKTRLEF